MPDWLMMANGERSNAHPQAASLEEHPLIRILSETTEILGRLGEDRFRFSCRPDFLFKKTHQNTAFLKININHSTIILFIAFGFLQGALIRRKNRHKNKIFEQACWLEIKQRLGNVPPIRLLSPLLSSFSICSDGWRSFFSFLVGPSRVVHSPLWQTLKFT